MRKRVDPAAMRGRFLSVRGASLLSRSVRSPATVIGSREARTVTVAVALDPPSLCRADLISLRSRLFVIAVAHFNDFGATIENTDVFEPFCTTNSA